MQARISRTGYSGLRRLAAWTSAEYQTAETHRDDGNACNVEHALMACSIWRTTWIQRVAVGCRYNCMTAGLVGFPTWFAASRRRRCRRVSKPKRCLALPPTVASTRCCRCTAPRCGSVCERCRPATDRSGTHRPAQVRFNLLVLTSVGISVLFFVSYQSVRLQYSCPGKLKGGRCVSEARRGSFVIFLTSLRREALL